MIFKKTALTVACIVSVNVLVAQTNKLESTDDAGIGTTTPNTKLQIVGGSENWDETTQGTGVGTIHLSPVQTTHHGNAITFGAKGTSGNSAQAGIYVRSDGAYGTKMYFSTTDLFASGSKTRMMIDYNGYVGIGTSTPHGALEVVNGVSVFSGTGGNYNENIRLPVASNGFSCLALGATPGGSGSGDGQWSLLRNPNQRFSIRHFDDERFTILPNGNVGIGSSTPGTKLVISVAPTTAQTHGIQLRSNETLFSELVATGPTYNLYGVGGGEIWVNSQGGNLSVGPATNHDVKFVANGGEKMRLLANGNLGIGTTAPAYKLDVVASSTVISQYANQYGSLVAYADGGGIGVLTPSLDGWYLNNSTNAADYMINGSGGILRINGNGNIGIGTSSPQSKLAVNGDIYAKKVKVTQTGWPDFVFNQEYQLKPLSEVEAFIHKYKHLPEVPSAEEVAKNDLDLGEMNRILLMKVEELTLYMIALKKENEALKNVNASITGRIEQIEKQIAK